MRVCKTYGARLATSRPLRSSYRKWEKRASVHEVAQRPSRRRSLAVDMFRLSGFESLLQIHAGKNDWHMLRRERREISLTALLLNCHDVTIRISDLWISRQTGMKSPLKWHNQPGKKLRTFRKSTMEPPNTSTGELRIAGGRLLRCSATLAMFMHGCRIATTGVCSES